MCIKIVFQWRPYRGEGILATVVKLQPGQFSVHHIYRCCNFFAFFLFLLFVIQLILLYRKRQTDESFSLMLSLLAIAIFSFFSYPFQYPHTWLIFFMCVQLILFDNREKQCKIYWPSKFIVVFSSILLFSITVKEMYFENKWYLIEHKRKFGNIQEVILWLR